MPAAENTNNFWNLGRENRGFPGTNPSRPEIQQTADYADEADKPKNRNSQTSQKRLQGPHCLRPKVRDTTARVPPAMVWVFGVF